MNLITRSFSSIRWNTLGGISKNVVFFIQAIVLARLLPVNVFGIYGLALAIVRVSVRISTFGMDGAFIHRARETKDVEQAASVYFSLSGLFTILWAAILVLGSLFFARGEIKQVLFLLTALVGLQQLTETPRLILRRRIAHKRLVLIDFVDAVLSIVLSTFLAVQGFHLLALISINLATFVASFVGLFLWKPVWKVRFCWEKELVRYYVSFGYKSFLSGILYEAIDRVDDIWIGAFLNSYALGIYSRAFSFATYPRKLIAEPINRVALGYYAELKHQPRKLAQAFFYSNGVLIRTGFLFAGILALIAPEFVVLLIGEKWLPMVSVFRLMLLFTLLSPLEITTSHLFVGLGIPFEMVKARAVQLFAMLIGLFTLGYLLEIEGVALTIGLTMLIGISFMFVKAKEHISFSITQLFFAPMSSFFFAVFMTISITKAFPISALIVSGIVKAISFSLIYSALIFLFDKKFFLGAFEMYESEKILSDY